MSQHDFDIANASGAAVRADLNNALVALGGTSIGATAPSTTYAGQRWFDTTANILKIRDAANTNWVNEAQLVGTTWTPYRNGTLLGTAAVETIGTSGSNVPKLDGANTWGATQTMTLAESPLTRGGIDGLILSNNASDATNDIDIAAGKARDAADSDNLAVASAIGKRIDASWASGGTPGSPTGGLSSSLTLTNDTWYHVILGKVSGTVEVGIDTSVTGANLVTDHSFTNTRRIGPVRRATALNRLFFQDGDIFRWDVPINDDDAAPGAAAQTITLSVPTGLVVFPLITVSLATDVIGEFSYGLVTGLDQADTAPSATIHNYSGGGSTGSDIAVSASQIGYVPTDTSAQIRTRASNSAVDHQRIVTHGWRDPRGRE